MVAPQQAKDYIVPLLGILKDFESVIPFWFLFCLVVGEDLLQCQVEFAEVVLAEAILVPAMAIEKQVIDTCNGDGADDIPFGV